MACTVGKNFNRFKPILGEYRNKIVDIRSGTTHWEKVTSARQRKREHKIRGDILTMGLSALEIAQCRQSRPLMKIREPQRRRGRRRSGVGGKRRSASSPYDCWHLLTSLLSYSWTPLSRRLVTILRDNHSMIKLTNILNRHDNI